MRFPAFLAILVLAGCSGEPGDASRQAADLDPGLFAETDGKSGLCIDNDGDAAFVLYGDGPANCMAEGALESGEGGGLVFLPRGDTQCRFPIGQDGDTLTFRQGVGSCDYYCGDGVELAGRTVRRSPSMAPLLDGAGERLC